MIKEKDYLKAKQIVQEYEKQLNISVVSSSATKEISSDALDGCSTIRQWEEENGRGFWGSETYGYTNDEDM